MLVDHGDEVILPVPYWVRYKDIIQYAGGKVVYVETSEERELPHHRRRHRAPSRRAPRPSSSTRRRTPRAPSCPRADLERIVRLAHERGIYLLLDECYVYLNYAGKPFSRRSFTWAKEHMVVLGSLSKTYAMTGWRAGFALGPKAIIADLSKLQSQQRRTPPAIVQKAAIAALTGSQECVCEIRAEYIRLRDTILAGLAEIPGVTCTKPEGAFYVYPNIAAFSGRAASPRRPNWPRACCTRRIVVVPGEAFGTPSTSASPTPSHTRTWRKGCSVCERSSLRSSSCVNKKRPPHLKWWPFSFRDYG